MKMRLIEFADKELIYTLMFFAEIRKRAYLLINERECLCQLYGRDNKSYI